MTLDAPSNQITREKSEMLVLPREECLRLIADHRFGRMAVTTDSPVIRPVNFLFDEPSQSVVFRTEPWSPGPKPRWMRIRAFTVTGRIVLAAGSPAT